MLRKIKIIFYYTLETTFNKLRKIFYLNILVFLKTIFYFKYINLKYFPNGTEGLCIVSGPKKELGGCLKIYK